MVIVANTYGQNIDLTQLTKIERDKKLIEIAISTMKKYAPSYYRDDLKVIIAYEGIETNVKVRHFGRPIYQVDIIFDPNIDRKNGDDNMYGGSVFILGDIGKAFEILPAGWMVFFEIEDETQTRSGKPHKVAHPTKIPKSPVNPGPAPVVKKPKE